ncbi:MAG: Rpn family recombination-promoting nuclease/putative transposase [Lachnospiraceae bacterium]|nr:Rpn family recombination-promoting nuclease/putative transposase [Lachnospiraceae bacterium]
MEVQNSLANLIDTAADEAQYDELVKKFLSYRIILAWILKECVIEFKQYSIEQIMECIEPATISVEAVDQDELDYFEELADTQVEGMTNEDGSKREGRAIYDIKFSATVPNTEEPVQLIINIEAQKDDNTTYPLIKRAIYYVGRLISAQKNKVFTNKHYEKICKVYSIWIQMNVSGKKANTITKYRISEENLVGNVKEIESYYDLLTVIMIGLGRPEKALDKPILRLLDVLLSTDTKPDKKKEILQNDYDISMTEEMIEEANAMCNLGEGIREKAVIETTAGIIVNIMQNKKVSFEDAYSSIFVPEENREDIKAFVEKQMADYNK